MDPQYHLTFIFLSNRVNPEETNPRLSGLSIRGRIEETVYQAMGVDRGAPLAGKASKGKRTRKKK